MPRVSPEVLTWARQTAGLSEWEAAAKIGIRDARGVSAADRIAAFEAGAVAPTRAQLSKMAAAYRRPLIAFYMAKPPQEATRVEDYRSLPDREPDGSEATLRALVRDIRARQEVVKSLLEDLEAEKVGWVGSMAATLGADELRARLLRVIGFDLARFRAQRTAEAAFSYTRQTVEAGGAYVLLVGNLGSHHTNIPVDVFRGFAIADPMAPFVVVNDQDAKVAWSFTLLHEIAHLALGASGISAGRPNGATERLCNEIASGALLPAHELQGLEVDEDQSIEQMNAAIDRFARPRFISRALVAYRLYSDRRIGQQQWRDLTVLFADEARQAKAERPAQQGAPDYYTVRRHRVGPALLRLVGATMAEGLITPVRAGKILGVRPRNVDTLLSAGAA